VRIPRGEWGTVGRPEPGFALGAALFALVVVAALVGGAFFAARQEFRVGQNHRLWEQASGAAEAGLVAALAEGAAGRWRAVLAGDSLAFAGRLPSGTGRFTGVVHRLNEQLFLVRATGTDVAGRSERSVGVLARLVPWTVRPPAALTVLGALRMDGAAWIDGRDGVPSGWTDCPPAGSDSLPGLLLRRLTDLQADGCAGWTCITGAPRVGADSALADEAALLERSGVRWGALVAMADRVYSGAAAGPLAPAPVATGSVCDTSVRDNWGEPQRRTPASPCQDHFPVIFADGGLSLSGGRGQGVLLVQGDLDIAGGAEFVGLVVTTGRLRLGAGGGLLVGAALALNAGGEPSSLEAGAAVRLSTCAVAAAGRAAAAARVFRDRFWLDLY
jgi:hypothetical protein